MDQSEYPNSNLSSILPIELRDKTQLGILSIATPFWSGFFLPLSLRQTK